MPDTETPMPGDLRRFGNYSTATNQDGTTAEAFANLAGTATDPTTVTLTIRKPDTSTLVYGWPSAGANGTLSRESAGRFYADVLLDQAGKWTWELAGTGTVTAASQGMLRVARRRVA